VKFSEVTTMALKHVENRGSKVLDVNQELWNAIITLCGVRKWRWRRNTGFFNTVAGIALYDLADSFGLNAPDIEEIESMFIVLGDGDLQKLDELTTANDINRALQTSTRGEIGAYFRVPGQDTWIRFDYLANGVDTIQVDYWRIPLFSSTAPGNDVIPLVPGYLHPLLVKEVELRFVENALGEADPKYQTVSGERDALLKAAIANATGG
jgi:hypothetical protein